MFDLLALAFQTDMTRVATFMFANEGSNRGYSMVGAKDGHHALSHHRDNPEMIAQLKKIDRYLVGHYAAFVAKLRSIREGEGTLLDNSMVLYGSGIKDGNAHSHHDLPILLAGRAGGSIRPGRHLKCRRKRRSIISSSRCSSASVRQRRRSATARARSKDSTASRGHRADAYGSRFAAAPDKVFASAKNRRYDEPAASSGVGLGSRVEAFIRYFHAAIVRIRGESFDGVLSRRSFLDHGHQITCRACAAEAGRRADRVPRVSCKRSSRALWPPRLFGLAGCEKPPTFSELINGKKKEAPPAPAPVVQASRGRPSSAASRRPRWSKRRKGPPRKRSPNSTARRSTGGPTQQLAELAALPEARDQITVSGAAGKHHRRRRAGRAAQV